MTEQSIILWEGREIRLFYTPREWKVIDHVEICSLDDKPLPLSKTGFRSHYFGPIEPIMTMKEVEELIVKWLDKAAQSQEWQNYLTESKQLSLL